MAHDKRILVVDDDTDSLTIVKALLEKEGFFVDTAEDGLTAWEKLNTSDFDLLISDVLLPGINGYDLLERIKKDTVLQTIPVIMVTAVYVTSDDMTHGYTLGAQKYLFKADALIQKPFNSEVLVRSVYEILELHRDPDPGSIPSNFRFAVVEDDPDTLEYVKLLLEANDYIVTGYNDPTVFVNSYEPNKFDMLLIDYNMPSLTGIDVIDRIRHVDKTVGIIIITAYGSDDLAYKALEKGANDFVSKPIRRDNFMHRLRDNIRTLHLQQHIRGLIYELKKANIKLMQQNEKLKNANKLLKEMAERDSLTNLYNRRVFFEHLSREVKRASRYDKVFSLIMFDIDNFKLINDTKGHHVGDDVLRTIAQIIESKIRTIDLGVRYGGEEFVVLLPETPQKGAVEIAERLRAAVDESGLCTISVGVAEFNGKLTSEDLVKKADECLYMAKNAGKNQVAY